MKRVISIILAVLTVCVLATPALAAVKDPVDPQYAHITSLYATIRIDSSTGLAKCSGAIRARKVTPVKIVVQLQQYKDGAWGTLQTWTNTGSFYASEVGYRYVLKGYTYRTKVTAFIYDESGKIIESASGTHQQTY